MRGRNQTGAVHARAGGRLVLTAAWLLLAALLLSACQQDRQAAETDGSGQVFRSITPSEAQALIAARRELLLLDVRTPAERRRLRIGGSRAVPLGEVMRGRLRVPGEQPLLLICAVGGRSYVAASVLSQMGYREVYNLDGGIESWHRSGLPLEFGPEPAGTSRQPQAGREGY